MEEIVASECEVKELITPARRRAPGRGNSQLTAGGLVRTTVYLEPAGEAALRQKAFKERRTAAAIVRQALREHLARSGSS